MGENRVTNLPKMAELFDVLRNLGYGLSCARRMAKSCIWLCGIIREAYAELLMSKNLGFVFSGACPWVLLLSR